MLARRGDGYGAAERMSHQDHTLMFIAQLLELVGDRFNPLAATEPTILRGGSTKPRQPHRVDKHS